MLTCERYITPPLLTDPGSSIEMDGARRVSATEWHCDSRTHPPTRQRTHLLSDRTIPIISVPHPWTQSQLRSPASTAYCHLSGGGTLRRLPVYPEPDCLLWRPYVTYKFDDIGGVEYSARKDYAVDMPSCYRLADEWRETRNNARAHIDIWLTEPLDGVELSSLDYAVETSLDGREPIVLAFSDRVRVGFSVLDRSTGAAGIVEDYVASLRSLLDVRKVDSVHGRILGCSHS